MTWCGAFWSRATTSTARATGNLFPTFSPYWPGKPATGASVIFVSDHHDPDDLEFQIFPVHCVKGTEEPEVIPELAGYLTGENLVPKNRYSGFFNTDLERRLADLQPDKVIVCGVCTDICVLHTTSDARNRDYVVEVPAGCVATFDPDAHTWALGHLEKILGAKVV